MGERKTPLYDMHVALGGKIVPFGGYLLPVEYKTGVIAEHMAVREAAGLFDVSHMGEVIFEVGRAEKLKFLAYKRFYRLCGGAGEYSPRCNEKGGIVDDRIVYKRAQDK